MHDALCDRLLTALGLATTSTHTGRERSWRPRHPRLGDRSTSLGDAASGNKRQAAPLMSGIARRVVPPAPLCDGVGAWVWVRTMQQRSH